MTALTVDELTAWVERTSAGWRDLLDAQPEALALPCDVYGTKNVAEFMRHIVAVELRYAERLSDLPITAYEAVAMDSGAALYGTHARAMDMLRGLLAEPGSDWEEILEFPTRSAGTLRASRRVVLVHLLMHSIRHYAQLATLVRKAGIPPGWDMDYLFMAG